jgi:hypothetical protein
MTRPTLKTENVRSTQQRRGMRGSFIKRDGRVLKVEPNPAHSTQQLYLQLILVSLIPTLKKHNEWPIVYQYQISTSQETL